MIIGDVGEYEAQDIRAIVAKVLRDLDNPEPPLDLSQVRQLFDLDLRYYSTADNGLLQEVTHRIKVAGKQILDRPMILIEAIKKAKLSALWIPETKRILIDETEPKPKHRWIEGHEIGHSLIPWHREFLFGDNRTTLDPVCHAIVEAEANYASARMLFMEDRFGREARDCTLNFDTTKALAKRYGNTLTTTFWRMIEDREPDRPVFGMMTAHPRYLDDPSIGRRDDGQEIRYFIRSPGFRNRFGGITPQQGYALIEKHATQRRKGPVFSANDILFDDRGDANEFIFESFCNHHALLTIGALARPKAIMLAVA